MIIDPKSLQALRARFQPGQRVRLIRMSDPYTKLRPGDEGVVVIVDSIGTIHVDWDNGSTLGVAFGEDRCELIEENDHG